MQNGTVLWTPPADVLETTQLGRFFDFIAERNGVRFTDYDAAYAWSIENLEEFWATAWDFFDIIAHSDYSTVLESRTMPGAVWFPGATLNYAEHCLRWPDEDIRLYSHSQTTGDSNMTGAQLRAMVGRIQAGLIDLGVQSGDRVVGYLPNIPEAIAAYLAVAGLGATWSSVPPEMGPRSVLDRIDQLSPSVVLVVDGYKWGTKIVDRRAAVSEIKDALSQPATFVELSYLGQDGDRPAGVLAWNDVFSRDAEVVFTPVSFDHPLAILFSSGTTGIPKAIMHCHGGFLLEHLKGLSLQMDVGPGSIAFWYTTTGWMVWNLMVSALAAGSALVLMDGDPGYPDLAEQWRVCAETKATFLGTSAGYLSACAAAGMVPKDEFDLTHLRGMTSSGSPLSAAAAQWVADCVNPNIPLQSTSGGTDICSGFVGGSAISPVYAGEMTNRPLAVATESFSPDGEPIVGEPGELVCTLPIPSMPVGFWGDTDGSRYRAAYFDTFPGIWRHGDWLIHTERDTWVITGRSDATLNRGGVRLGTAEFYAALEAMPDVADSMVLHFEDPDTSMGVLVVCVVKRDEAMDDDELSAKIKTTLRTQLSPRHVPDLIVMVPGVARNHNGKKLEVPVKRIVQGTPVEKAVDPGTVTSMDNLRAQTAAIIAALG